MCDDSKNIYIYTLGRFSVKDGNSELISTQQRSSKRWLLFQLLFTYRNDSIPVEKIYDYVELNESVNPPEALKVLVYYLRQNLNNTNPDKNVIPGKFVICEKGQYYFNIESEYWFDGDEFELLFNKANSVINSNPDNALRLFKKALNFYQGEYLMEVGAKAWVLPTRNYYRRMYLTAIIKTCKLLVARDDYQSAIELCMDGLKTNPFEENLHEIIINSFLKSNQTNLARIHCEDIVSLYKENDLHLPTKLQKLYTMLCSKKTGLNPIIELTKIPFMSEVEGALVCNIDIFKFIYKFEKAKKERKRGVPFLVYFKLPARILTQDNIEMQIHELENIFKAKLRKSDLFCPWNKFDYVLLLNSENHNSVEIVIERLKKSLAKELDISQEDIEIRIVE